MSTLRSVAEIRLDLETALAYKQRYGQRPTTDPSVQMMRSANETEIDRLETELAEAVEREWAREGQPTPPRGGPPSVSLECIAELRELLAKAEPGPWRVTGYDFGAGEGGTAGWVFGNCENELVVGMTFDDGPQASPAVPRLEQAPANAKLIVGLLNAAPALLEATERAKCYETALRMLVDAYSAVDEFVGCSHQLAAVYRAMKEARELLAAPQGQDGGES